MSNTAVVILNWNGREYLRRFLPQVVEYSRHAADVVVVDNGSTDGSAEMLAVEFANVKLVRFDQNYGFAGGYNRALQQLDYKYCILLNSDVEVSDGWIEPLVRLMDRERDVAAAMPKILSLAECDRFEYAGASGGFIDFLGYPFCRGRILQHTERDNGQYDSCREVFWASGAAMICRRGVFVRLGGFCEEFFAHMEEIDLCWRMQLAGWRIMVEPVSTVWHLGGGTLSTDSPRKVFLNHRNNLAMLYRCSSPLQRVVVAVVRPLLDAVAALSYLAGGKAAAFRAVGRAYIDFFRWHGRLSAERRAIRAIVRRTPVGIYRGSIVARYFMGRRKFNDIL